MQDLRRTLSGVPSCTSESSHVGWVWVAVLSSASEFGWTLISICAPRDMCISTTSAQLSTKMAVDGSKCRSTNQVAVACLMKWYVATSSWVTILFGHAKIDEVWGDGLVTEANKDILWLNITVDIAVGVDVLDLGQLQAFEYSLNRIGSENYIPTDRWGDAQL